MRFEISYRGQQAGWVIAEPDAHGILFRAESRVHTMAVLRLYGITAEQPLLIGVLEPENKRLSLVRRITPDVLRRAGVQQPPEQYYLDDGQPGCKPEPEKDEEGALAQTDVAPESSTQPPEPDLSAQADTKSEPISQSQQANLSAQADTKSEPISQPQQVNLSAQTGAESQPIAQSQKPNPSAPEQPAAQPQQSRLQTGDALLDALIIAGKAKCTKEGETLLVRTPFLAGRENPMNFALTACHLENGDAILRYRPAAG